MKNQNTIFRQLLDFFPRDKFQQIVDKYQGDRYSKSFKSWHQFVSIFYAQLKQRDCLREIETGLEAQSNKLYHLGLIPVKRSTLSDANNRINYRIYEEAFYFLLSKCQFIAKNKLKFENPICSLDASVINLCYSVYPWAKYQTQKGALKLHMRLDHAGYLPNFMTITEGKVSELTIAKTMSFSPDSILVFDRGYNSYEWFYSLHLKGINFVTRVKNNFGYRLVGQHPVNENSSVIADEDILIPSVKCHKKKKYLVPLRLVTYEDPDSGEILRFLTNNENFKPETIALIYKQRWQIELFFKWIKQRLIIKSFIGTSKNAVFSQIWIALIVYLLIWYIKHQIRSCFSLTKLTRILNEAAFERQPLLDILGLRLLPSSFSPFTQLAFAFG